MSRVIKFRAYVLSERRYDEGGPFHIIGECTMFSLLNRYRIADFDNLIIEQFTGRTDKNGKEVYENDIVILYGKKYVVGFSQERSAFCLNNMKGEYVASLSHIETSTVISNIHEKQKV